ncbi:MAG: UDP-galactopyranose mutase, partial [Nitrospira sp.]
MLLNESVEWSTNQDIVCLSHLRWNWVFQRPQQLLTRAARRNRVFFVEEPLFDATSDPFIECTSPHPNVIVAIPHLPRTGSDTTVDEVLQVLLPTLLEQHAVRQYLLWYYTPMALTYSRDLTPHAVVYDCMDQL